MPDEKPDAPDEKDKEKPSSPEPAPSPAPDIAKLSSKDQRILSLRKEGYSMVEIGKRLNLSKTAVFDRVKTLQMRGFLDLSKPGEGQGDEDTDDGSSRGRSSIMRTAAGRAALEASTTAAKWAAETIDLFAKTGEWAWGKYKERAESLGYENILAWLSDCVEYWETERLGWQSVLDELHLSRQRIQQLETFVDDLRDARTLRRELMELVLLSNVVGKPMTGDQLLALLAPREFSASPVRIVPALEAGGS